MFFIKKKITESGVFYGMCDFHSHILPAVDDGVRSTEEALAILNYYEGLGITKVMLTPHIMEDVPQDISELRLKFESLKSLYHGNIELSLAAEYMLDYSFFSLLEKGNMLTLWDNYLLVEMSYAQPVVDIFDCVRQIMAKGYFVVLAHPERYLYLNQDEYKQLKEMGVYFQLNLPSICGTYGKRVKDNAYRLLKLSYYDVIGTDIHNFKFHYKVLTETSLSKKEINLIQNINNKDLKCF